MLSVRHVVQIILRTDLGEFIVKSSESELHLINVGQNGNRAVLLLIRKYYRDFSLNNQITLNLN
jgi:hypothetical protein